eukprot:3684891-Pleurochrysis_carterae.AAC.1
MRGMNTNQLPPSRRVLLFSGPYSRPDGISTFLHRYGILSDCVDKTVQLEAELNMMSSTTPYTSASFNAAPT